MKEEKIEHVLAEMSGVLGVNEQLRLREVLHVVFEEVRMVPAESEERQREQANEELLQAFIAAKKIEGCSENTLHYYESTIASLLGSVQKRIAALDTNDIRAYLACYQRERGSSRVTIDNLRRIFSSFFAWLEDEDCIAKSPVRRIHKVRTESLVKEVISDENLEMLRDACSEMRDLAMVDLLASTGMRVGELVKMNREDIDFHERQCVVLGKGNKEREVYFNARTKIHLQRYLESRTDENPALFVALSSPHSRLTIGGVETRLRNLGKRVGLHKIHPHKFRRTLATMAIDKGMPIEQVQRLLGHVKIDTTLHYAMVNQTNVKMAHRKYIG
jgi:phage integrase, N-terminal SAM domain protein